MSANRTRSIGTLAMVAICSALLGASGASARTAASNGDSDSREGTRSGEAPAASQSVSATHRVRGSRPPSTVRPRSRVTHHGVYIGWSPYWGATWNGYWGGYWEPYWYGPRFGYTTVYPRTGEVFGALDTDVSPERAEVWVDGRQVGRADDFDGFPNYLWLEKGTYDVVFYLPGYKTLARQYSIYPGLVIDVEDRLERGEATHPLDLGPASHERRDDRLRRDEERQESAVERPEWGAQTENEPGEWLDARSEPGRLRLTVEPHDASVYLDGRFVGTGGDLGRLRAGLLVDSGAHTVEIVRPGYASVRRQVEVEAGDESELRVALDPVPPGSS